MDISLKMATLALAFAFLASTTVFAKGGDDDDVDLLRGSQAWFMAESSEHAIGKLNMNDAERLTEVKVTIDTARTTTAVELRTADQVFTSTCRMVDHASKGGTRIKKEVICQ
ncbi:MAG: hypothetical protein KF767_11795 [Bdellovibrionaceae bacterium]|nr:hypothetical protein [Pseudobdellovibrionaceae bacterium]